MTATKPFWVAPLRRGHAAIAALSTPGSLRKRSANWYQTRDGCEGRAPVSRVRTCSAEKPVG